MRGRWRLVGEFEGQFFDEAPVPVLARFERPDDRVLGVLEVSRAVTTRRVVAATDVPAGLAHSEMHPIATAGLEALLTPGGTRFTRSDGVEVRAHGHGQIMTRTAGHSTTRSGA